MPTLEEQHANIKKWFEALESGKYMQGSHRLRKGNFFCCLGVAADLLPKTITCPFYTLDGICYDGSTKVLSSYIREQYALKDAAIFRLTVKNDHGASFKEIVNYMKTYWKLIFSIPEPDWLKIDTK